MHHLRCVCGHQAFGHDYDGLDYRGVPTGGCRGCACELFVYSAGRNETDDEIQAALDDLPALSAGHAGSGHGSYGRSSDRRRRR